MKSNFLAVGLLASTALLATPALAHLTYGGGARDFGIFQAGVFRSQTLSSTASSNFGWADGTDDDFGDSHRLRAFRFNLDAPTLVTIDVAASTPDLFPAFSLYEGLVHLPPAMGSHDHSTITELYLQSLGGVEKEGAFRALTSFTIGNDPDTVNSIPATLITLDYIGHVADGTAANYGPAAGVNGDGVADNLVAGSFFLPAGDYTLLVGGGNYATQSPGPTFPSFNFNATVTVVPEPSSAMLAGLAGIAWLVRRGRRPV
jgi:hypothetical protein